MFAVCYERLMSGFCSSVPAPDVQPKSVGDATKISSLHVATMVCFVSLQSRSSESLGLRDRSSPLLFISRPERVLRASPVFREANESTSEEALGGRESGYGSIEGSSISWSRYSDAFSENELDISKIEEN